MYLISLEDNFTYSLEFPTVLSKILYSFVLPRGYMLYGQDNSSMIWFEFKCFMMHAVNFLFMGLIRVWHLQGLKKADQQTILDDFNKHGPAITQPSIPPSVAPAVPAAPAASVIANNASLGFIASREDVLTRAAALGRGAATTGFKRFLALTEAAKDRKDGPFRKLFNT